jgi:membrane associated rhomboid family serine protease
MSISQEIKDSFKYGSVMTRLIYINIAVFLLIKFVQLIFVFGGAAPKVDNPLLGFLMVPSSLPALLTKPWTLLTYMFAHNDFIHLLFNILYIYWFGRIFMEIIGERLLLRVYLLGGLSGAALYIVSYNLTPAFSNIYGYSQMLGASASAMAILFTVARNQPDHRVNLLFFGPVKLKYIALVALLLDLISISNMNNTGGHIAHIGGGLFGFIFGKMLLDGKIAYPSGNKSKWSFSIPKKGKMTVLHSRPLSDMQYNTTRAQRRDEVDRILEKIKQSGYDSLSKEEKKMLFDAGKDDNFL